MMTEERLAQIEHLCVGCQRRMSPERAFTLLKACAELCEEARRWRPTQPRLDLEAAG